MLKRFASSPVGLAAIALALLAGGFLTGMRVADRKAEEDVHTLMLIQATLHLTQTSDLATALRNGMVEPALDRIEGQIDSAIIDIGPSLQSGKRRWRPCGPIAWRCARLP